MKQICVCLLLGGMLLAGCHRRTEAPADTVPPVLPEVVTDTQPATKTDSVADVRTRPQVATLHYDTAAETNLRLFARKQKTVYSPALLVGEWQRGSEHEQYTADGHGRRWDASDDVDRVEAQSFIWTMDSNLLTFRYDMALGGLVVRQYVVTFVDDETLVYRDAYGDSYLWDKLPSDFTDRPPTAPL